MIIPPSQQQPIVSKGGFMTAVYRTWTQLVTREQLLTGTGTPETFVEALPGTRYMDDAGIAGAILYIKRDADIAGDKTKGWILT